MLFGSRQATNEQQQNSEKNGGYASYYSAKSEEKVLKKISRALPFAVYV